MCRKLQNIATARRVNASVVRKNRALIKVNGKQDKGQVWGEKNKYRIQLPHLSLNWGQIVLVLGLAELCRHLSGLVSGKQWRPRKVVTTAVNAQDWLCSGRSALCSLIPPSFPPDHTARSSSHAPGVRRATRLHYAQWEVQGVLHIISSARSFEERKRGRVFFSFLSAVGRAFRGGLWGPRGDGTIIWKGLGSYDVSVDPSCLPIPAFIWHEQDINFTCAKISWVWSLTSPEGNHDLILGLAVCKKLITLP